MATKSAKSENKKTPTRRKRATPLKFKDEQVDNIVKEITDNMKNSTDSKEELEEEVKLEVKEKISESPGVTASEQEEEHQTTPEEKDNDENKEDTTSIESKDNTDADSSTEKPKEGAPAFAPDKSENPFPPLEDESRRSFKWPLIYFILFLAGMVTGFVIFDQLSSREGGNPISLNRPSATPTRQPTTTPTPAPPDFSKYTIMLENGSGTAGVAADLQAQLEAADFNVSEIGNADNSNYDDSVIQVKNGTNTTFLKALRTELEKTYTVAKETEELPDSEEFDAVVIIGSKASSN